MKQKRGQNVRENGMAEEMSVIGAESGSDLGQELNISLSEADIDEILERKIGKLADNVEIKQGEASIVLGTIK